MPSAERTSGSSSRAPNRARPRWPIESVEALFALPFSDLIFRAQRDAPRAPSRRMRSSSRRSISIKTGGCPEDCGYCPQAKRYHTGVAEQALLGLDTVVAAGARREGAGRDALLHGRRVARTSDRDLEPVLAMVREVKALGLETCCTLGMLRDGQAEALQGRRSRLLQPQPRHLARVLRRGDHDARLRDRLDTLEQRARGRRFRSAAAGSSGWASRARSARACIAQLANLDPYPESVPINHLVQVARHAAARALGGGDAIDPFEFVRTIAVARITMPKAMVRLSAGRRELGDAVQALCFLAGANSIFYGDKLLTTGNPDVVADRALFARLGLAAMDSPAA